MVPGELGSRMSKIHGPQDTHMLTGARLILGADAPRYVPFPLD